MSFDEADFEDECAESEPYIVMDDAPVVPLNVDEARDLVNELARESFKLKQEEKELKARKAQLALKAETLKRRMIDAKLPEFKTREFRAVVTEKDFFSCPGVPQRKDALFNFLKERQVFHGMVSVNGRTLTSWVNRELSAAKDRGDFDFRIPGLGDPFKKVSIEFKKNK